MLNFGFHVPEQDLTIPKTFFSWFREPTEAKLEAQIHKLIGGKTAAIEVISLWSTQDNTVDERTTVPICQLTKLCLNSKYLKFSDSSINNCTWQCMGSPLSPITANLYMEVFEDRESSTLMQSAFKIWLWYVDDTFVIWLHAVGSQRVPHTLQPAEESINPGRRIRGGVAFPWHTGREKGHLSNLTIYRKLTHKTDTYSSAPTTPPESPEGRSKMPNEHSRQHPCGINQSKQNQSPEEGLQGQWVPDQMTNQILRQTRCSKPRHHQQRYSCSSHMWEV